MHSLFRTISGRSSFPSQSAAEMPSAKNELSSSVPIVQPSTQIFDQPMQANKEKTSKVLDNLEHSQKNQEPQSDTDEEHFERNRKDAKAQFTALMCELDQLLNELID
ncbi:uncharacterized protein MONOS_18189 [Monocercomonoides exilis]|uniref:uncharacterized protein n=1 Tax=Monocercomonoides exilis TaxID=2049356 RepID=UPI0035596F1B|nr:hypothetical protein MONOS_18189 [Monocercomonoides exilis]